MRYFQPKVWSFPNSIGRFSNLWHSDKWNVLSCDKSTIELGKHPNLEQPNMSQPQPWVHDQGKACKGVGQEGSPRSTSYIPESARKGERMNPHTPKRAPTLGVGVSMESRIFREWLQGSTPIGLKSSLYHWKFIETYMSKMGSHDPFGHLKHKLWPKERSRVKLAVWLPTTKSQE